MVAEVKADRSAPSGGAQKRKFAAAAFDPLAYALAAATRASQGASQSTGAGIPSSSPAALSGVSISGLAGGADDGGIPVAGVTKAKGGMSAAAIASLAGADSVLGMAATGPSAGSFSVPKASASAPADGSGPSTLAGMAGHLKPPQRAGLSPMAAALLQGMEAAAEGPTPADDAMGGFAPPAVPAIAAAPAPAPVGLVAPAAAPATAPEGDVEKAGEGVDAIKALLKKLGLVQYFDKFVDCGFDTMAAVEMMTEEDMVEECEMTPEHVQALKRWIAGDRGGEAQREGAAAVAALVPGPAVPKSVSMAPVPKFPAPGPAEEAYEAAGAPRPAGPVQGSGPLPVGMVARAKGSGGPMQAPVNDMMQGKGWGQSEMEEAPQAEASSSDIPMGNMGGMSSMSGMAAIANMGSMPTMEMPTAAPVSSQATAPLTLPGPQVLNQTPIGAHNLAQQQAGQMNMVSNLPACLRGGAAALQSKLDAMPAPDKLAGGPSAVGMVPPGVRAMMKNQQPGQPPPMPHQPANAVEQELGDPVAVAMAAAQQPGGAANTLYTLAQMAQESAQYAQQAAALTSNPADAAQAKQMADAAEQAAQRAAWATTAVSAYEPPEGNKSKGDTYIASIVQICQQASETAEQAANTCRTNANNAKAVEEMIPAGPRGERRSRVPCKFFEQGMCQRGADCPLSHNPIDKKPIPLWQKRQYLCTFFADDKCIRGEACAFAHGPEELEMIKKFKAALKDQDPKYVKRPGDWDCPQCGDRQFARNGSCRKCGEPRPLGAGPVAALGGRL